MPDARARSFCPLCMTAYHEERLVFCMKDGARALRLREAVPRDVRDQAVALADAILAAHGLGQVLATERFLDREDYAAASVSAAPPAPSAPSAP